MKKVLAVIGLIIGGLMFDAAFCTGSLCLNLLFDGHNITVAVSVVVSVIAAAVLSTLLNLLRRKICRRLKINLGIFLLCTQLPSFLFAVAAVIYAISIREPDGGRGDIGAAIVLGLGIVFGAAVLLISAAVVISAGISKFRADIRGNPDGFRP